MSVKLLLSDWGKVFENRALREKFGAKREEITGDWRQLQTEEQQGV